MLFNSWISLIGPVSSLVGIGILLFRFDKILIRSLVDIYKSFWFKFLKRERIGDDSVQASSRPHETRRASIVIPARNEESNLPKLFASILALDWVDLEVVIVDDESTDRTRELTEAFIADICARHPRWRAQLVRGRPRPVEWTGKNWACHQGFAAATGDWVLFTDADTMHEPLSLRSAIARMEAERLDLLSAVPFHRSESWWERGLGPFHIFLFISTAAFSIPKVGRVFAIGQYLLFRREAYLRQGGHEQIRNSLCDDIDLAEQCMKVGGRYRVEGWVRLYRVRMYDQFAEFIRGWRRIFRLGFYHARVSSSVDIYFVIAALTGGMRFFKAPPPELAIMIFGLALVAILQRRFGEFSIWGVLFLPLSLLVFVVISLLAVFDILARRDFNWRGRSYSGNGDVSLTRGSR
jgi:chlorobactene glucosyltransferase